MNIPIKIFRLPDYLNVYQHIYCYIKPFLNSIIKIIRCVGSMSAIFIFLSANNNHAWHYPYIICLCFFGLRKRVSSNVFIKPFAWIIWCMRKKMNVLRVWLSVLLKKINFYATAHSKNMQTRKKRNISQYVSVKEKLYVKYNGQL